VGGIFVVILYIILQLWAAVKNPTFSSLFQPCQCWSDETISTSSFWRTIHTCMLGIISISVNINWLSYIAYRNLQFASTLSYTHCEE